MTNVIGDSGRTLNERQKALVGMIANGTNVAETAKRLKVRRVYVLEALRDPLIKAEVAAFRDARRLALQPKALNRLDKLIDSENERVALGAVQTTLGDDAKAPTVNVDVNVNNQLGIAFKPGYVIRLPAGPHTDPEPTHPLSGSDQSDEKSRLPRSFGEPD